jgi:hypothetical protein
VGFSIEKPNGERIVDDMANKIADIFDKNIEALKVKLLLQSTIVVLYF